MPKKSKSGRPAPILVPAGLKLNGPFWEIVRAAFKRYGLNPDDLADWRALLWFLECGPEKRAGGRPLTRQRPILDWFRRRQRAQEIAEIVDERMKLEPHGVGCKRSARQPRTGAPRSAVARLDA
jgi:hypothetical protein